VDQWSPDKQERRVGVDMAALRPAQRDQPSAGGIGVARDGCLQPSAPGPEKTADKRKTFFFFLGGVDTAAGF